MRYSTVQQLALLGKSVGVRMPPVYSHQWANDGRCQAKVMFNNITFAGSLARNYEQAVESAAGSALFHLVRLCTSVCFLLLMVVNYLIFHDGLVMLYKSYLL